MPANIASVDEESLRNDTRNLVRKTVEETLGRAAQRGASELVEAELYERTAGQFLPLDAEGKRLMFQVFADAYERQSVLIATNLGFSRWDSVFVDDQMATAVIARIVHHGRLVQFSGESYRVPHALMQEG